MRGAAWDRPGSGISRDPRHALGSVGPARPGGGCWRPALPYLGPLQGGLPVHRRQLQHPMLCVASGVWYPLCHRYHRGPGAHPVILRHGFAQRSRARAHRRRRRNEAALLTVSAPLEAGRDVHQVAMRHRCLSPISRHALCWDRAHRRSVRSDVLSRRHGGGDVRLDVHGSAGLRAFEGRADRPATRSPP